MISLEGHALSSLTIGHLRRDTSLAPGGNRFSEVVAALLPLTYGAASALLGDRPAAVTEVALSAFESLAFRWRSLPRRTVLASWLVQTVTFAASRERQRLGVPDAASVSAGSINELFLKELFKLKEKFVDALIVGVALGHQPYPNVDRALHKLQQRVQNAAPGRAGALLKTLQVAPPLEVHEQITGRFARWSPRETKSELVQAAASGWRRIGIRRFLARTAIAGAVSLCILAAAVFTFVFLATRGYLNNHFLKSSQRDLVKEFPELAVPARPFPASAADAALVSTNLPKTASALYALTNIWLSKLGFTEEQWEGITPSRVAPVRNMMGSDGKITLRNPNASRSGLSGVLGIEFEWTAADLEFAGQKFPKAAVRYRGNGTYLNSLYGPKQSFKIDLNKNVKGQKLAKLDELNLLNCIADSSYLHDALAQEMYRALGIPGPRTAYTYLTIDVPGRYTNQAMGLYLMMENIDGDFAEDRFGSKKAPIFKPVTYDLFKDLGNDWSAYADIYDLKTDATAAQKQRVIEFSKLVTHATDDEFTRRLGDFVDLDKLAAFVAGHVLLSSYDGFLANGQNYYLYLDPRSNKFGFIPWDQDHSWGEFRYVGTAEGREQASIWKPYIYDFRFLDRAFKVESFREKYRSALEDGLAKHFTTESLYPKVDQLAARIRPGVAAESDFRLRRFDVAVSDQFTAGDRDAGDNEGPRSQVHQIKRFIGNRAKSIRDQLDGKSDGVLLSRTR